MEKASIELRQEYKDLQNANALILKEVSERESIHRSATNDVWKRSRHKRMRKRCWKQVLRRSTRA